ncbi:MAG TPA: hypothetical protein VK735_17015 [Pseudonocardia sp.]|uniref:hypothetical protein n=1 Tax=Pseudonocardia sp. TaxID=60912 RepID=UPI002C44F540|nr:hypothetical protein [Pseudonocardia sp.]HTF49147.1 hypothetical protein [Pseudonocardia sp.]
MVVVEPGFVATEVLEHITNAQARPACSQTRRRRLTKRRRAVRQRLDGLDRE